MHTYIHTYMHAFGVYIIWHHMLIEKGKKERKRLLRGSLPIYASSYFICARVRVRVCMGTYTCMHVLIHIHTYIHTNIHAYIHTCKHPNIHDFCVFVYHWVGIMLIEMIGRKSF